MRAAYEAKVIEWINTLKGTEEYRAAWWVRFLRETDVMEANSAALNELADLTVQPANANYSNAIAKLEVFAAMVLATGPQTAPECFEHTSEEIQREAKQLNDEYGTVPWIKDIIEGLMKKTDKG